jgi:hypothetical protein
LRPGKAGGGLAWSLAPFARRAGGGGIEVAERLLELPSPGHRFRGRVFTKIGEPLLELPRELAKLLFGHPQFLLQLRVDLPALELVLQTLEDEVGRLLAGGEVRGL